MQGSERARNSGQRDPTLRSNRPPRPAAPSLRRHGRDGFWQRPRLSGGRSTMSARWRRGVANMHFMPVGINVIRARRFTLVNAPSHIPDFYRSPERRLPTLVSIATRISLSLGLASSIACRVALPITRPTSVNR